eukprot:9287170-Alexandrium_andersonii.AAC.1
MHDVAERETSREGFDPNGFVGGARKTPNFAQRPQRCAAQMRSRRALRARNACVSVTSPVSLERMLRASGRDMCRGCRSLGDSDGVSGQVGNRAL